MKVNSDEDIRANAVRYTMLVLRGASDWQEGQHALANHSQYGPWIREQAADEMDEISICQSIIRDAEDRLGDELPY